MAVTQEDLEFQSSSNGSSEGGTRSGTPYSNAKGLFFPNIADVDRLAGGSVVRKWFLYNDAPTDALISPSIWVQQTPTYCTEEIGLGFDATDDDDEDQGNMTEFTATAAVALVADASDTREATIWGLDGAGDPAYETVELNGASEVTTTGTFSVVYAVVLEATDGINTVTVKQGSGGTTRGTIGPDKLLCFLWLEPTTKGAGIHLPDLASASSYGFWSRVTWPASTPGVRPNNSVIGVEEN